MILKKKTLYSYIKGDYMVLDDPKISNENRIIQYDCFFNYSTF